jgi:hypothetical protein
MPLLTILGYGTFLTEGSPSFFTFFPLLLSIKAPPQPPFLDFGCDVYSASPGPSITPLKVISLFNCGEISTLFVVRLCIERYFYKFEIEP